MAKLLASVINLSGNFGELNFVNRKDGKYVRRKRGSIKPAKLNDALRRNVERHKLVNRIAVPINAVMKQAAGFFKTGRFWRSLLSRLKKCENDRLETQLASLAALELNHLHRMKKHVALPVYHVTGKKDHVVVKLEFCAYPKFRGGKNNSYYYEVILLLWDKRSTLPKFNNITTNWVHYKETVLQYELLFERLPRDKYYLLVLRLQGGRDKRSEDLMRDKAMVILGGGVI